MAREAFFPTRWKYDKPPSIERFMADFPDDYACAEHLARKRWPDGFVCPHCGSKKGWRLEAKPWVWECAGKSDDPICRRQTSVIAGTVMHGTHLPLRTWFIAAYLVATHSNSISALQLQAKLGLGSYKTAWLLLHKLRRAMVNPDRTPLQGDVEIDESSIPYRPLDDPFEGGHGKSLVGKIFIIGAVEKREGRTSGRIRLAKLTEDKRRYIQPFVVANTAAGCAIYTDANRSYVGIPDRKHFPKNLSEKNALPAHISFERIHRVFSNLKRWGLGTFHGFREKHLDAYLHEFEFRWNRRRHFHSTLETLLGIGQSLPLTTYRDIVGDTSEWRQHHKKRILEMVSPERREAAKYLAKAKKIDILDALDRVGPIRSARPYKRRLSERPVLAPRRRGEERFTARYRHPPRPPMIAVANDA
jgi:hypothetical protein